MPSPPPPTTIADPTCLVQQSQIPLHLTKAGRHDLLFWPERASIAGHVTHNLREILGIRYDVYVPKHLEVSKVLRDALLLERLHKGMVRVQVGNDLEPALERYDLPLQVTLEDAARSA